ncbi:MAG TPA: aldehyde ferredoxin oxidoreductase [Thermus scotoductus]|nr:aldehyde ferredoxin oxidoreductase [Thermus scotoductus]
MWRSLRVDLLNKRVYWEEVSPEEAAHGGRYRTGRLLLEREAYRMDPLSPENPLVFAVGPLAGTGFSNANRTSVGTRSPLTLGIKEANGGGTFGYALGQMKLSHLVLEGASSDWVVLRITREGQVFFDPAEDLLGLGNFEAAAKLFAAYGRKIAFALLGPVGEYLGLLSGIAFSDIDGRPSRLAARGGVGAVMGSKRVKAIVVEVPGKVEVWDKPKVTGAIRRYAELLRQDPLVMKFYNAIGTMGMADFQNAFGGLPVRNFRQGQLASPEEFRMGGQYIAPLNKARGGKHTHACMPGCVIQCSNVIVDEKGEEVVSPLEYETIGLMGTNCGLTDPDQLARLNRLANDLGVDTIETGATLALFMEKGEADFGDYAFMEARLKALYTPSEEARFLAQGTARVGEALGLKRVPVIKRQAISAYDPRVVEATGITMMITAQGADHTAGNAPRLETRAMPVEEILEASYQAQVNAAANDALGLCVFGGSVTNKQVEFIVESVNAALGTHLTPPFWKELGERVLHLEHRFNHLAGFTHEEDRLPAFFYEEPLPPKGYTARFRPEDLASLYERLHQGS